MSHPPLPSLPPPWSGVPVSGDGQGHQQPTLQPPLPAVSQAPTTPSISVTAHATSQQVPFSLSHLQPPTAGDSNASGPSQPPQSAAQPSTSGNVGPALLPPRPGLATGVSYPAPYPALPPAHLPVLPGGHVHIQDPATAVHAPELWSTPDPLTAVKYAISGGWIPRGTVDQFASIPGTYQHFIRGREIKFNTLWVAYLSEGIDNRAVYAPIQVLLHIRGLPYVFFQSNAVVPTRYGGSFTFVKNADGDYVFYGQYHPSTLPPATLADSQKLLHLTREVFKMTHPFDRKVEQMKVSKTEINKLIMDYFITAGYPTAAEQFSREANIRPQTDFSSINERVDIRDSIHKGDLQSAIEKINELNPALLDTNAALHFSLLRLQLIELIRTAGLTKNTQDIRTALDFATENLAPVAPTDARFLNDLEQTMALLIFPPEAWENAARSQQSQPQVSSQGPSSSTSQLQATTQDSSFGALSSLVDPSLRRRVAEDVNQAILHSQGERREAKIFHLVKARAYMEKLAREKKIGLPARLDIGLDGDQQNEANGTGAGANGHANANGSAADGGGAREGDTDMAENDDEGEGEGDD